MALFDFLKKSTKVFDVSENKLFIAGLEVDGVVSVALNRQEYTKTIQGTHGTYTTVVRRHANPATLSITLLPTSVASVKINQLASYNLEYGVFFDVVLVKNKEVVLKGTAWFQSLNNETITDQADDINYTLGINITFAAGERGVNTGVLDLSDFVPNEYSDIDESGGILF